MFARLISVFAVLFACVQQPCFAGDSFKGFEYFFKPIPIEEVPAPLAKMMLSNAVVDSVKKFITEGTWVFKPSVTVVLTSFDKKGVPSPFNGTGAGISFQREITIKGVNKTTLEIDADWLIFNNGTGPALLVGALNGPCVGASYDVKNKSWLALTNFSVTLFKN